MSFLTDETPFTDFAVAMAVFTLSCELTNPLSWTTPLKVSTLISADLSVGCSKIAVFTLAVIAVSSTYWPVLSDFGVEAQPTTADAARIEIREIARWNVFIWTTPWLKLQRTQVPRRRLFVSAPWSARHEGRGGSGRC